MHTLNLNYTVQETTSHVNVSKKNDTTYLKKPIFKKCYHSYSNRILGEILTPPPPLPKKNLPSSDANHVASQ